MKRSGQSSLCSYCHHYPRRPGDAYCSRACQAAKRRLNKRNKAVNREAMRARRAEQKRLDAIEAQRIYQHSQYMKRRARALLREQGDEAHRLTPVVEVTRLNLRTWESEIVRL